MIQSNRRSWKSEDDKILLDLWDVVGSVFVIALMLKRTRSSVQTRASRLGLPARLEESDKHRRKWQNKDDIELEALIKELMEEHDGKIPIQEISDIMGRSIDALASRIEDKYGEKSEIMGRIVPPPPPPISKHEEIKRKKRNVDEKKGKIKTCLKCKKSFWSEGNHNWICVSCKRSEDWDWDY